MRRFFTLYSKLYSLSFCYQTPSNLSYFWNFGSLAMFILVIQITTGIGLSWWYIPSINEAFLSVEYLMREVTNGWLMRYLHANGASMFFACVYLHMFRSLYYASYQAPRFLVWWSGIVIFLIMIVTAFLGYVLPWGQMSYWAATVITSLTTVIPLVGDDILTLIWGGYGIGQQTLTRFYSFHHVLPFILVFIVSIHLIFPHETGSSDPVIDHSFGNDKITFHPYYTYKDLVGILLLLCVFFTYVFFLPNSLGHPLNYIAANPGVTPVHIVPEWYFLPFYGILRTVPSKFFGVFLMLLSIVSLGLLSFTQTEIKHGAYRGHHMVCVSFYIGIFVLLGWVGKNVLEHPYLLLSSYLCVLYFMSLAFIIVLGDDELDFIIDEEEGKIIQ